MVYILIVLHPSSLIVWRSLRPLAPQSAAKSSFAKSVSPYLEEGGSKCSPMVTVANSCLSSAGGFSLCTYPCRVAGHRIKAGYVFASIKKS